MPNEKTLIINADNFDKVIVASRSRDADAVATDCADVVDHTAEVLDAREEGATVVLATLAGALGLKAFAVTTGESETFEGDVAATLTGILHDAGVFDHTNIAKVSEENQKLREENQTLKTAASRTIGQMSKRVDAMQEIVNARRQFKIDTEKVRCAAGGAAQLPHTNMLLVKVVDAVLAEVQRQQEPKTIAQLLEEW